MPHPKQICIWNMITRNIMSYMERIYYNIMQNTLTVVNYKIIIFACIQRNNFEEVFVQNLKTRRNNLLLTHH